MRYRGSCCFPGSFRFTVSSGRVSRIVMIVTLMDNGTVAKIITCNVALVLEMALVH